MLPSIHDVLVSCNLEISDIPNLKYIIDTGAMSSIIKYEHIRKGTEVLEDETKFFGLIKDHFVQAVGKVTTFIKMDRQMPIEHTFYIIQDDINIPNDGILGSDFLRFYNAKIDYLKNEIEFQTKINLAPTQVKNASTNTDFVENAQENLETTDKRISIGQTEILKTKTSENDNSQKSLFNESIEKTVKKSERINNKDFYKYFSVRNLEAFPKRTLKIVEDGSEETSYEKMINHFDNFTGSKNKNNEILLKKDRLEFLQKEINLKHCSLEEVEQMNIIFAKYSFAFNLPGDRFEHSNISAHKITLKPDTKPVFQRQFRIPEHQREELRRQLLELESNGIIEKSDSPWNSPIFLVPKKEDIVGVKQSRLVVDYRELNKVIEPTSFPIPLIDEIIDKMNGSQYFSTLDLAGAYHQIPLEEKSKQYTAFSTSWKKYHFTSVPFGLSSSPFALLKAIHELMDGINGAHVYMDDIIVFSPTLKEHIDILSQIFEKILQYKLKLKIKKSYFLLSQVTYLGFIISSEGLKTDPKKVECINKFPRPKNVKQVQSFLGVCNYYRRYINNYAGLAKCLYNICKKDQPFNWTNECENSFNLFKELLSNPPILIFPDFSKPFIIQTDCSLLAASGILSQG